MVVFSEDFFSGYEFEAVLVIFHSYDCGANSSETVEKIATNGKSLSNGKCSLCVA